jgi:phosphohistidine swiveling domain-containing protein
MPHGNPIHQVGGPTTAWSTVNAAENFPGVATPLGWTFWRDPLERAMRGSFVDMGVLSQSDIRIAESVDDRFTTAVFGRFAGNVDQMRMVSDLMPGTSGAETERQIFGSVRPDVHDNPSRRRYPIIALKMPAHVVRLPRRLKHLREEVESWWRDETAPRAQTAPDCVRQLVDAATKFEQVMRAHMAIAMLATAIYARLTDLAESSGHPGLETVLASGYGGLEETQTIIDLWKVSRDELPFDVFIERYGYHAPVEAEIASVSWREDPTPARTRAHSYRDRSETSAPWTIVDRQRRARVDAEARVLAGLPVTARPAAQMLFRVAKRYIPLREVGKTAFLQTIDVGRTAARALGRQLFAQGVLADPQHIYFLAIDELVNGLPDDVATVIDERQALCDEYRSFRVPDFWVGVPTPITDEPTADTGGVMTGIAVSPGVVEGLARVMTGPDSGDLEDDEILVCNTTDPSWASLFVIASALVIDIGGTMSHGAIVAREMGIPCVINTQVGTRIIKTGDRIRVDGSTGMVHLLDHERAVNR